MGEPGFVLRYDSRWVELDLTDDPSAWAEGAARDVWAAAGREPAQGQVDTFAWSLAALAEAVRGGDAVQAFVLCPEPWDGPTTVVTLTAAPLAADATREDVVAQLSAPDAELVEPQETGDLETGAGPAIRIRQRVAREAGDGRRTVTDRLLYAWPEPDLRSVLLASTTFTDLVESGRWTAAVDELAAGLTPVDR